MLNRLLLLSFALFMALTSPCAASRSADRENPCACSDIQCEGDFFTSCRLVQRWEPPLGVTELAKHGMHYVNLEHPVGPTLRALHVLWKWEAYRTMGLMSPQDMIEEVCNPACEENKTRMRWLVNTVHVAEMRMRLKKRCTYPCGNDLPGLIVENAYQCMYGSNPRENAADCLLREDVSSEKATHCLEEAHALLVRYLFPEEGTPPRVDASSG